MELPEDVKVTITDMPDGVLYSYSKADLPNVCDPADDTICDSCA